MTISKHPSSAGRSALRPALRCFDLRREPSPQESVRGRTAAREESEGELLCFACGAAITRNRERIPVGGAHEHTFTNPAGYVFCIGCFRRAPGCPQAGEFTAEHTWFPGYAWRYALCAGCRIHLGWVFRGGQSEFYGLILDRLLDSS